MQQLIQFIFKHYILVSFWVLLFLGLLFDLLRKYLSSVIMISANETIELINRSAVTVIDIRSAKEFNQGHIIGSLNFDFNMVKGQESVKLSAYKKQHIVIVCADGTQSTTLAKHLCKQGFQQISVLKDGILGWTHNHLPLIPVKIRRKTKIEIYTRTECPYCTRAKALLKKLNINFKEIVVDTCKKSQEEMKFRSSKTTVPQIFINDQYIGGYDDLEKLEQQNELLTLLQQ